MSQKTVFVTGSSRGIGRAAAIAFAKRGYHVFINSDRSDDELYAVRDEILSLPGGTCDVIRGDVSDPDFVREAFHDIRKICGRLRRRSCDTDDGDSALDILVNNAGVTHFGLLTDMTDKTWRRIIDVNLSSVFYCCREAAPGMVARKSGGIINVSSVWGVSGASCEAAYSASKAGVIGLTKALAKELAPSNVRVNAIACGCIDTAMNNRLTPDERAALTDAIPMGRFGTPEEAASLIYALAEAPAYLTGEVIGINGGFA